MIERELNCKRRNSAKAASFHPLISSDKSLKTLISDLDRKKLWISSTPPPPPIYLQQRGFYQTFQSRIGKYLSLQNEMVHKISFNESYSMRKQVLSLKVTKKDKFQIL